MTVRDCCCVQIAISLCWSFFMVAVRGMSARCAAISALNREYNAVNTVSVWPVVAATHSHYAKAHIDALRRFPRTVCDWSTTRH